MLKPDMSKSEIESQIQNEGEYVQIDWLTKHLKTNPNRDIRNFIFLKLAKIYEKKLMIDDAAKMYENLALNSIAFTEKIKYYMKETELWIKKGDFDQADKAMRHAVGEANSLQKKEIYFEIKHMYKKQAAIYEQELKRNHALKIYEKLMQMGLEDDEKYSIRKNLIELYEKLGKYKEAEHVKKLMS